MNNYSSTRHAHSLSSRVLKLPRIVLSVTALVTVFAALVSAFAAPQLAAQATGGSPVSAAAATLTPAAKFVDSARVEIDAASRDNDTLRLARSIVLLDRALTAFPKDPYLLHYRAYANYRRVVNAFRANNMANVAPLIASGIADLQQSTDKLQWPESYSILATFTGFRIAMDPSLGQELGMEMGAITGKALSIGPKNPRVLLLQAYGAQNTPPEYGGGVEQARAFLERALSAFEIDKPGPLAPTWGREEALALKKQLGGDTR